MKKSSLKPIHLAVVLALVGHLAVIGIVFACSKNDNKDEEVLRVVSTVEVVDKIKLPARPKPPMPVMKKTVSASQKTVTPTVFTSNPGRPGKPGKPGWSGPPSASKKPGASGKPGWSGRSGLKTAIDPDMPKLGVSAFGEAGYPTGHGYGKDGSKFGKHSGFGPDGDGGEGGAGGYGEGGEGGEGGGMIIANMFLVINPDSTISVYNESVSPSNLLNGVLAFDPKSTNNIKVNCADFFSITIINNYGCNVDFRFAGEPPRGQGYVGTHKAWSPYLWKNIAPGQEHREDELVMAHGIRDCFFYEADTGYVISGFRIWFAQ